MLAPSTIRRRICDISGMAMRGRTENNRDSRAARAAGSPLLRLSLRYHRRDDAREDDDQRAADARRVRHVRECAGQRHRPDIALATMALLVVREKREQNIPATTTNPRRVREVYRFRNMLH
ncbi:MAG TPA: hypothetical protein VF339_11030 [Gammaproteobacteria bacterium]